MKKIKIKNLPGIYKVTNLLNGKLYIGQSRKLRERITQHRGLNGGGLLSKAIEKYGVDNFLFEVLIYCDISLLDDVEIYYIKPLDCKVPNGYNIQSGGQRDYSETSRDNKPENVWFNKNLPKEMRNKMSVSQSGENNPQAKQVEDITGRIWNCLKDCAKELDVRQHDLSSMLTNHPTFLPHLHYLDLHFLENRPENYTFKFMEEIEHLKIPKKTMTYKKPKEERNINATSKRVVSNDGRIWESVSECARGFNMKTGNLCRMLKGQRTQVEEIKPYGLKYENPEHAQKTQRPPRKPKEQKRTVRRKVVDKFGRVYNSIRECAKIYDVHENLLSSILRGATAIHKRLEYLGLTFVDPEYEPKNWKSEESKASKRKGIPLPEETKKKISERLTGNKHPQAKKVIDNTGRMWLSCQDAAKEFNIRQDSFGQMLLGRKEFREDLISFNLRYKDSIDNNN